MSKVYEPVKNFYILAPYFLEDLLGLGCWGLDYDEIGKNLSIPARIRSAFQFMSTGHQLQL